MNCYICGRGGRLETHHIFNGALRKKSERYKALIRVCGDCHREIHKNISLREGLKGRFQKEIMEREQWTKQDFIKEFYKNYME